MLQRTRLSASSCPCPSSRHHPLPQPLTRLCPPPAEAPPSPSQPRPPSPPRALSAWLLLPGQPRPLPWRPRGMLPLPVEMGIGALAGFHFNELLDDLAQPSDLGVFRSERTSHCQSAGAILLSSTLIQEISLYCEIAPLHASQRPVAVPACGRSQSAGRCLPIRRHRECC